MAEQKNNMTDRQLAEELQKGKRGGLGGRLLEILGVVVIAAGAVFGGPCRCGYKRKTGICPLSSAWPFHSRFCWPPPA